MFRATGRNVVGLGMLSLKESTGGKKARGFTRISLVPWEWGLRASRRHSRRSALELRMKLGDWNWKNEEEVKIFY